MNAPLKLGQSILRREDRRFLTGRGRYADDTAPPGALAVLFLRSPHAHARLIGIDKSAALASPGVAAIYTADDLLTDKVGHLPAISEIKDAAGNRHREPQHLPMPAGKVRHVGDIVAMIVAETLDQARDAAEALAIDYQALPAVVTVAQALAPGAPLLHDDAPGNLMCRWGKGDAAATDAAFARAAHVTSLAIRSPRQIVHYMETRAAWSAYDPADDVVTVTFSSQGVQIPHRLMCERVLDLPKEKLRLVTEDVGGGFGPKYPITAESTLIAWATRKLRRGLRWTCERAELAQSDSHARDLLARAELALDGDGRFLGLRVKAQANYGAYVSMFAPTIPTTGLAKVISGLYRIPAIRIDFDCAFTNTVPVDAIRGAGKPEALFLLERLLDIAAHETGRTRAELRRLNLLKAADMPYASASGYTYDAADRLTTESRLAYRTALDSGTGQLNPTFTYTGATSTGRDAVAIHGAVVTRTASMSDDIDAMICSAFAICSSMGPSGPGHASDTCPQCAHVSLNRSRKGCGSAGRPLKYSTPRSIDFSEASIHDQVHVRRLRDQLIDLPPCSDQSVALRDAACEGRERRLQFVTQTSDMHGVL